MPTTCRVDGTLQLIGVVPGASGPGNGRHHPRDDDAELQRALEASELEEAMAQSRLAAPNQLYHGADHAPADSAPAASDDQELKLAMELSEAEAKQAAKGKGVLQRAPSDEELQRALQESARLASTRHKTKQPAHANTPQHQPGEGSSTAQLDQETIDADLARALYESEQLASGSASFSGQQSTAPPTVAPSAPPMVQLPAAGLRTQQGSHSSSPPRLSHSQGVRQQPGPAQPAATRTVDGKVQYPDIYQPGSTSYQDTSHQALQQLQQQMPSQQHQLPQQPPQRQLPNSQQQMPQQVSPRQQHQQAAQSRLPSSQQPHRQHHASSSDGNPSDAQLYLDGHHGSANLEAMLNSDEAFAKALQEEEYKAARAAPVSQPASTALQQPGRLPDLNRCPGCGHRLNPLTRLTVVGGQSWHVDCFKCSACQQPIPPGERYGIGAKDGMPYHMQCYRQKFDPRCEVCHDFIPSQVTANLITGNDNQSPHVCTCTVCVSAPVHKHLFMSMISVYTLYLFMHLHMHLTPNNSRRELRERALEQAV